MAAAHGDRTRAVADHVVATPSRHFLTFDGRGQGLAVEVLGDLAHADRVAVLVPGSDTTLETYSHLRAGAAALQARLNSLDHGHGTHQNPPGTPEPTDPPHVRIRRSSPGWLRRRGGR